MEQGTPRADASALAAAVLEEETRRSEAQGQTPTEIDESSLPGADSKEAMSLREALHKGGRRTIAVVAVLNLIDLLDNAAFSVLAPDIQDSLGVSDATLGALGGATGILFVVGAIPLSTLSDRISRKKILAAFMSFWSVAVFLTGFVVNAFQMFIARLGAGLGQSASLPVNGPLLMDTYPIEARSKVFALNGGAQTLGMMLAPFAAGSVAAVAGDESGWRWAFILSGVIALPFAVTALAIREPQRGRFEMQSVLGEVLEPEQDALPISLSVAFERLRKIRSFYFFLLGMASLGFALFSAPIFLNLYFDEELGLDAFERGYISSIQGVPGLIALVLVARRADELFTRNPPAAMAFIGVMVAAFGSLFAAGIWMPNVWLIVPVLALAVAIARAGFAVLPAVLSTIIPYRLRARGVTLIGLYLFLFGAFFGAILTGLLSDAYGERAALTIVMIPATLVGGFLIALGARHIKSDMAMVSEELIEEREERDRINEPGAEIPVVQVRNLDFSYGRVQVLFDVGLEVQKGETLALLGTNGAGKSTLLRVISGLGVPQRGVVRFNGRTVTYADAEVRSKIGIVQLIGGGATFPPLTVAENMESAAFLCSRNEAEEHIDRALDLFPMLREQQSSPAQDLSGGQQQMLALAMTLVRKPEILIIDELSLGLAPVVVQEVLGVIRHLKSQGMTMIIVEQSLNIALSIADRAVFMERGAIRFDGPARDLATRDDLARAVFLGRT